MMQNAATTDTTLAPLGPTGPARPDIMDPSAAMTSPGSPFSPCMKTNTKTDSKSQKKKSVNHVCVIHLLWIPRFQVRVCKLFGILLVVSGSQPLLSVLEVLELLATPCPPLDPATLTTFKFVLTVIILALAHCHKFFL